MTARPLTEPQARKLSKSSGVQADVDRYGDQLATVDSSIALHKKLGIREPWDRWEWPRRLAYLDRVDPDQRALPGLDEGGTSTRTTASDSRGEGR